MLDKLVNITYQLLDLGKRNRLLNYKDTGLKTLTILNKNIEEMFRNLKAYRDCPIFNIDPVLNEYHNENYPNDNTDNPLQYSYELVYEIARKYLQPKELLCYKKSHPLNKALKSLAKDFRTSIVEKGMNSLYASFGFIHYVEEEEEFVAPLILIPVELLNEEGFYKIRQYEDEILLNPTLKYYFSNLYNVELINYNDEALSTYFERIKEILPEGTYLEESMALGIYSFYKMNMYNDLMTHKNEVIQNKNIRILLGDDTVLEDTVTKQPIYPVVNCDSSQLGAIQMAADGKSFCLQGPPGSGKSQTITNMISSLLGAGKKILFVSEKISALRVVFENLRRVRLSEFAIELHSNKANKKEFIENLYRTATLPKYDMDLKTRFLSAKYQSLVSKLANYDNELSEKITGMEMSILDLYSMYLSIKMDTLPVFVNAEKYNIYDLNYVVQLLNDYIGYSKHIGYDYRDSSLHGLNDVDESYILYELGPDLDVSINHVNKLYELALKMNTIPGMNISTLDDMYPVVGMVDKLCRLKTFEPGYLNKKIRIRVLDLIERYLSVSRTLATPLFDIYDRDILKEDLESMIGDYNAAMNTPKGLFKFGNKELKELNDKIFKYRPKAKPEEIIEELPKLLTIKRNLAVARELQANINNIIGETSISNLKTIALDLKQLDGIDDYVISKQHYLEIKRAYAQLGLNGQLVQAEKQILFKLYRTLFEGRRYNIYKRPIEEILTRLVNVNEDRRYYTFYSQAIRCIEELKRFDACEFLNTYLDSGQDIIALALSYKKTFIKERMDNYVQNSNILNSFDSLDVEDSIGDFRDLDERILNINRDFIISTMSQKRPNESVIEGSEFKILTREYNKQRRQLPIRTLLEQTFELVLDIKPVFLMSPLSVSTYLASELNMFDCVIFDEASQIFASDALGSIYRAKQCIIIGDTKQMPPTNFFHASMEAEEDIELDLESILDKASTMFDMTSLKWHYRSRSEELITFSNGSFYDGGLITIPQSKKHETGFGIDFYYVPEGRYDATSRTNPIEANRICDMVFEHFKERGDKESLGVVAFSNVQAELISSLVEKRLKKYPEYQKYFDDDLDEPFFVKNLETVQGDERDRIIFSICYAYNEEGKFYQRFGPLNNSGGERRLNVAITRAKFNVSVVASVKYYDIKEKTEAKGVQLLRSYLEFAENVVTSKKYQNPDNSIINDVKTYVEELGYTVYPQYGTSSFKIELAVMKDNEFILAIMTDSGSNYSTNLTDRYRLEKLLLERLGWRYFKLYSTAWVNDVEEEKERLRLALLGEDLSERIQLNKNDHSYLRIDDSIDSVEFSFDNYVAFDIDLGKKYLKSNGIGYVISSIINVEAPVHRETIYKRVAAIMDKAKPTAAIKDMVDDNIPSNILKLDDFYYKHVSDIKLRVNSDRDILLISLEELEDGILTVVNKNNGISIDGSYRAVVQILGIDKISQNARRRLDDALESLKAHDKLTEIRGNLFRK